MEGCRIHYQLRVQDSSVPKQGLIFVHGNGAHSRWWDHIAPAYLENFHTAALDLSGAGDSDHRNNYSPQIFAQEILAVMEDAGFQHPVLIAHSFGGTLSRIATWLHPDRFKALILVDSVISSNKGRRRPPDARGRPRFYPTVEEAMLRFRLRPPQPCQNRFILDYIARHSVHQTESGWCFKADQLLFSKMSGLFQGHQVSYPDAVKMISEIKIPVALIYGKQSRFFESDSLEMATSVISPGLLYPVGDAYHHLFLDQPLSFIQTLDKVLNQIMDEADK